MRVLSKPLPDDTSGEYSISRRRIRIIDNNTIVWDGIITDAGGLNYGNFGCGTVKPKDEYEGFDTPKDLAEEFNLSMEDLILSDVDKYYIVDEEFSTEKEVTNHIKENPELSYAEVTDSMGNHYEIKLEPKLVLVD